MAEIYIDIRGSWLVTEHNCFRSRLYFGEDLLHWLEWNSVSEEIIRTSQAGKEV